MSKLSEHQKTAAQEVLRLLADKGFSLHESDDILWAVKAQISAAITAPSIEEGKKPLSELLNVIGP